MATNTYVALDKVTVTGSAVPSITFTGIPATYTDLVLVITGTISDGSNMGIRFNSDSTTNYSNTVVYGNGSSALSTRSTSTNGLALASLAATGSGPSNAITHIMNYANTTTYKTVLQRGNNLASLVRADVGLWRKTPEAINSIYVYVYTGGNLDVGSTFSLYGISTVGDASPKATGGDVYSDATYWYHAFTMSGNFVPNQTLSCDYLVVAGGGSGGGASNASGGQAGGAGAGSLVAATSQTLTAGTYPVLIGGGGAQVLTVSADGNNGTASTFNGLSATGGGGGGGYQRAGVNGGSGGGGGGDGAGTRAGGTGTTGGNNGGTSNTTDYNSAGGGGAGGTGGNSGTGTGGVGSLSYSSWGSATGTGQNVSGTYYYAGGGGGGGYTRAGGTGGSGGGGKGGTNSPRSNAEAGTVNTGGGGGGGANSDSQSGGSGIVIVRYAK
jgi:hypothetical protein